MEDEKEVRIEEVEGEEVEAEEEDFGSRKPMKKASPKGARRIKGFPT